MSKRFTDTETFDDPWFQELTIEHKCFWKFITEKCDTTGMWKENLRLASFLIGCDLQADSILEAFEGRIHVEKEGYWFLPDFIEFQYGTLSEKCNPHKPILKLLARHIEKGRIPQAFSKGIPYPSATLPDTLPTRVSTTLEVQEKEKEKVQEKEEVQEDANCSRGEDQKEDGRNPEQIAQRIAELVDAWSPHLNYSEQTALSDNLPKWLDMSASDWQILRAWYADTSDRSKYRTRTKSKLIERPDEELAKAIDAGFTPETAPKRNHSNGPAWLPENWRDIASRHTGKPQSQFHHWHDVPRNFHFEIERECKGFEAPDASPEPVATAES